MQYDIRHIGDFIFKKKDQYKNLSDDDKDKFFFIMNRKFARKFPKHAHFFNSKNIDKSSALDVWYNFFIKQRTTDIPGWYWFKLSGKKEKSTVKKEEIDFLINYYEIKPGDIDFLIKYFPDELEEDVKKIKKFNK